MVTVNWDDYDDCYHLDNEDDGDDSDDSDDWISEIIRMTGIIGRDD